MSAPPPLDIAERRTSAPIHRLSRSMSTAAAVHAALELGVLDAIADSPGNGPTATDVAQRCQLDRRGSSLLLDALVDAEVVNRDATGRLRCRYAPEAIRMMSRPWDALVPFLRSGTRDVAVPPPSYRPLSEALGAFDPDVTDLVAERIGDPGRILDVAAGVAPWSRALLAHFPEATATLVDLPDVAELTASAVAADGLVDRCTVLAGNVFSTGGLDGATGLYDTVLVANVCRLYPADDVRRLIGSLAERTAPGGSIIILDALPDGDRPGGGSVGLYALGLALRSAGEVHPLSAYAAWLFDAGYVQIEAETLGIPELSLIRASRPD